MLVLHYMSYRSILELLRGFCLYTTGAGWSMIRCCQPGFCYFQWRIVPSIYPVTCVINLDPELVPPAVMPVGAYENPDTPALSDQLSN